MSMIVSRCTEGACRNIRLILRGVWSRTLCGRAFALFRFRIASLTLVSYKSSLLLYRGLGKNAKGELSEGLKDKKGV